MRQRTYPFHRRRRGLRTTTSPEEDERYNLFVRLSSKQVEELISDLVVVVAAPSNHDNTNDNNDNDRLKQTLKNDDYDSSSFIIEEEQEYHRCWSFQQSIGDGGDAASSTTTSFLPLELITRNSSAMKTNDDGSKTSNKQNVIYASYNGGRSNPNYGDVMEIPDSFFSSSNNDDETNNNDQTYLTVRALPMIRHCTRVEMDPKTIQDWELLEVHAAEVLERGGLLQQVSVVYQNQQLLLKLPTTKNNNNNNSNNIVGPTVTLIVKNISTLTDEEALWPSLPYNNIGNDGTFVKCALLVQDTEVVITPKPRRPVQAVKKLEWWSKPLRLIPSGLDLPQDMDEICKQLQQEHHLQQQQDAPSSLVVTPTIPPPGCIMVHPSMICNDRPWMMKMKAMKYKATSSDDTTVIATNTSMHTDTTKTIWVKIIKAVSSSFEKVVDDDNNKNINDTATNTHHLVRVLPSDRISPYQAVLHPWIRWNLGLSFYVDSVKFQRHVVEPGDVIPSVIAHQNIWFQPIDFDATLVHRQQQQAEEHPWRLVHGNHMQSTTSLYHKALQILEETNHLQQQHSSLLLSVNSLVVSSSNNNDGLNWNAFRVMMKQGENHSSDASENSAFQVLSLNPKQFLEQIKAASTAINENQTSDSTENIPIPIELTSLVSTPIVSSIDWTKPILNEAESSVNQSCTNYTLFGPTGSGKTHSALILGQAIGMVQHRKVLYMDCARLQDYSVRMTDILDELCEIFKEASDAQHAVIVFDDLDRIIPNLLGGGNDDASSRQQGTNPIAVDQSKTITDVILHHVDAIGGRGDNFCEQMEDGLGSVTIISTCSSKEALNTSFCQHFQSKSIEVPMLSKQERGFVLQKMLRNLPSMGDDDNREMPPIPDSFRPRDIAKVAYRVYQAVNASRGILQPVDALRGVLSDYIPISNMSLAQSNATRGPDWKDIGALFQVKSKLESMLLRPTRYRAIYARANVRLPRGIMLFGPPGCGKSILVPALAKECGFPLIACKGPEVLDKYIGASEAKVRELFDRAMAVAPSILFLDELDALAPRRGSDHTGVTDRVVNQLLTYLDGVEDAAKGTVYVIGASSRPDKIDPALLRPGRLEEHLFIGPPDNDEEWTDLFQKMSIGWNVSSTGIQYLTCDSVRGTTPTKLISSGRFCAADFRACLNTAHVAAVHRALSSSSSSSSSDAATNVENLKSVEIDEKDLQVAFATCKPCLGVDDARTLDTIYRPFKKIRNKETTTKDSSTRSDKVGFKTTLR